jgi:hypothetical protein
MKSTLSSLQTRILEILAVEDVGWTLSGGGALAGFHLGHRRTDDLDLFFHGRRTFDQEPRRVEARLASSGMTVDVLITSPGFVRLSVSDGADRVVVDLVAEPVPCIAPPIRIKEGLTVDAPHEILVNKLCALVSRSELRDLEDVRALVGAGGDLQRALTDASEKDGGFSPMILAWLLPQLDLGRSAELGFDSAKLAAFRDELLERLSIDPRARQ